MLGISTETDAYRTSLLQWARGVDVKDYDNDSDTTEIRKQLGDPLHSRPVIITYGGTTSSPDTTVFFATNEGFLYAVDGEDGAEQFSFIPQELLPNLNTYYKNATASTRPYGLDGTITAWVKDVNGNNQIEPSLGDKVYIFIGMRRGGRNYYALDVTDRNNPKVLWSINGGSGSFTELGQTWSAAVPAKIQIGTTVKDVLIFAGGYDEDQDTYTTRTADTQGRAIYMVDIATGAVVWDAGPSSSGATETYADMQYSIPGDIRVIDVNGDGLVDQMWVGDMGGQLWRFDIANGASNAGALVTGAVVLQVGGTSTTDNRRFYYSPDVSLIKKNGSLSLNVAIGSGWRASPLNTDVIDRFYTYTSTDVYTPPTSYVKSTESDLYDATQNLIGQGTSSEKSSAQTALDSKLGWFITMETAGEKVLAQSVTINNQIIFTTYIPSALTSGCQAAQGGGRTYLVNVYDATPILNLDTIGTDSALTKNDRFYNLARGGIPPTPTPFFPDNGTAPFVLIGPEKGPGVNFGELTGRTFWYEKTY
jgi:type IV pilus assembly protein PilY1